MPAETLEAVKDATVHIKAEGDNWSKLGTGFLVWADETTGYIVTTHGIIRPPNVKLVMVLSERRAPARPPPIRPTRPVPRLPTPRPPAAPRPSVPRPPAAPRTTRPSTTTVIVVPAALGWKSKVTVTLHSGTKEEQSVSAELVAGDPAADLAVLQVTRVKDLPKPIEPGHMPELVETMPLYFLGFPLSQKLGNNVAVKKATVTSLRMNDKDKLAYVQMDGDLNPGNGGGPVVDDKGCLVGIVRGGIEGSQVNFCTPATRSVHRLFLGKAHEAKIEASQNGEDNVDFRIESHVFDPIKKLRSASVHYLRAEQVKEPPRPNDDGEWQPLPDALKADLTIEGSKAICSLTMPGTKTDSFYFQIEYVNGEGKNFCTKPVLHPSNGSKPDKATKPTPEEVKKTPPAPSSGQPD